MACRPVTSPRRWRRSSAQRRGCQPRPSVGCLAPGRPTTKPSASVTWPSGTMCTSGRMGSTSGSVWSRPTCAAWCWWGCAPTAPRNWSRSPTGSGSRLSRGRSCCGICAAAGCGAPVVAVGDGALGLWAALRDVFPATRQQRDWVHKLANVLNALPNSVHAGARKALAEIRDAPDRDHAERAIELFARDYGVKWPKAVAKITNDAEALLTFYDFPAEHWLHLKTSNPIESTFSTVRLRTRVTKGPGSKAAGLAMAFKLLEAAQDRWRAVNGPHLVALVRAGARFEKGVMVERPDEVGEVAA